jgi:hypothetical protein
MAFRTNRTGPCPSIESFVKNANRCLLARSMSPGFGSIGKVLSENQSKKRADFKPRLVVFVGTVGSGKSTQMRLLEREFRAKGLRVKSTHLKSNSLLAAWLIAALARILARPQEVTPIRALIDKRPDIFRRLFRTWLALDVLGIALLFVVKILLPLKLRSIVLVEEYLPATIADYLYLSRVVGCSLPRTSFAVRLMLAMSEAAPAHTIFLDARLDELERRWKRRKSYAEKPDYLQMQRTLLPPLSKMISSQEIFYVDTTGQSIAETNCRIATWLSKNI